MTRGYFIALLVIASVAMVRAGAEEIITLDGQKYDNVKDVRLQPNGLYFVTGTDNALKGVTVPYDKLPEEVKARYHYDPFENGLTYARQNRPLLLSKAMAFSLDNLEAAKAKAKAEKKLIGFIMVWDSLFVSSDPLGHGSASGLAHFYDGFHNGLVLVFVRHENELDKVPAAVRTGFFGPEEGGFAPNMAVVTADCEQFVCEIPFGGRDSNGAVRENIFRQKIAVIKQFLKSQPHP